MEPPAQPAAQPPAAYLTRPPCLRPSVPVTCRRAAQSASAAHRLEIQTAAPPARGDPRWGGRRRRRRSVPAMEHRIVGPGPYRATKLVSRRAGTWAKPRAPLSPGLVAGRVLVSPRLCKIGWARLWRRDPFWPRRPFCGRCSKKGLQGLELSTSGVGAASFRRHWPGSRQ